MANWCSNSVAFEGNEIALEHVKLEFIKMQLRENEENCGQLPEFISDKNRGYFFDILLEDGDCIFNYQTRWSPNTEILLQIAEYFKVDFILQLRRNRQSNLWCISLFKQRTHRNLFRRGRL